MNAREALHRGWSASRGSHLYGYYDSFLRQYRAGIPEGAAKEALSGMLRHLVTHVPFYSGFASLPVIEAPFEALRSLPLISKAVIRERGDDLLSDDLLQRKWHTEFSGGSTGEPVRLVQDAEFRDRSRAAEHLLWHLVGGDFGRTRVTIWGSERDYLKGGGDIRQSVRRVLTNSRVVTAWRMNETSMRHTLALLERRPPRLIVAYSQAIYELARFAERKSITVRRQNTIVASADTLHPFMRETIERVFGCPVYNLYGSRECGAIASEIPGCSGLWIPPWQCHIEIVDSSGVPVDDGVEGEIAITSLSNFAMPLVRFLVGDRGVLAPPGIGPHPLSSRVLERIAGRTSDVFRLRDGTMIAGELFLFLMHHRAWVRAFQVVQKREDWVVVRVVLEGSDYPASEWEEIRARIQIGFGADCRVDLEIVDSIPKLASGKFRYLISEVE